MRPIQKCKKLQFTECPLEAGYKKESIPIDSHVKKPDFRAELSLVQKTVLVSITKFFLHDNSEGGALYVTHSFKLYRGLILCYSLWYDASNVRLLYSRCYGTGAGSNQ